MIERDPVAGPRNSRLNDTLTDQVIARVRDIGDPTGDDLTAAMHCILDTLGVAIGGSREMVTTLVRTDVVHEGGTPRATVWGTGERVTRPQAALLNGTAAHALDFDDVSAVMEGHPSAPLLPALLAAAEDSPTSGRRLLSAFIEGFEVEALIGRLMKPSHYARGFHSTATVGAFGAAAGVAYVLGLDEARTRHAYGIAGSRASGLKSMFGTMAKPLQVGAAAESGYRAAALAARGVTAHPDVLGTPRGFRDTQSDGRGTPELWNWPGFAITDVLFKYHAACYLTHSAIEGILSLRRQGLADDDVAFVDLVVPAGHLQVCDIAAPVTPLEGKFSLRFTTALALVGGDLSESAFTSDALRDRRVTELRDRVRVTAHTNSDIRSSIVKVTTRDGGSRTVQVDVNRPTPTRELARRWETLVDKFHALVDPVMGTADADAIVSAVRNLPAAANTAELIHALAGSRECTRDRSSDSA